MTIKQTRSFGLFLKSTAIVAYVAAAGFGVAASLSHVAGPAWAEGEGQGAGSGGQGGSGQGAGGEGKGGQGEGGQGEGKGQGGPGEDSDGKGPQAGTSPDNKGKPVWAQEGIPEVELGRLSVARSPAAVLDRALIEALATLSPEMVSFYNLSVSEMISELSLNFDEVTFIDSPLQNLALLQDALDGTSSLSGSGVTTSATTLVAVFLGTASDKTIAVTPDTVVAVTTILGTPITGSAAEDLAAVAEAIRVAILAGHG